MSDLRIDEALNDLLHPLGAWQLIQLIAALSIPSTPILSIFLNALPSSRCRGPEKLEAWFRDNGTSFAEAAALIGPVVNSEGTMIGCHQYSVTDSLNATVGSLIAQLRDASNRATTIDCQRGRMYEYADHHYKGGLAADWDLVCDRAWQLPFNESAYMIGMMLGFISGGMVSDRLGRKRTFIIYSAIDVATAIALTFSPNHIFYIVFRILTAACITARVSAMTVLQNEITTPGYRTILSSLSMGVQYFVHRALMSIEAYFTTSWRHMYGITAGITGLGFLSIWTLCESPKWLAAQGRIDEAAEVLYRGYKFNRRFGCRGKSEGKEPLSKEEFFDWIGLYGDHGKVLCVESVGVKAKPKISIWHIFNKTMIRTTVVSTLLLTTQITCYFGVQFASGNIRQHVALVILINSLSAIPGMALAAVLYRVFHYRKKPLIGVLTVALICTLVAGLYTIIAKPESDLLLNIVANVIIVCLIASQKMIFTYVPELYTPLYRTQGFGMAAGLARVGALIFPVSNRLDMTVMHGFPLVIYGAILVVQLIILCFLRDTNAKAEADDGLDSNLGDGSQCASVI